MWKVERRFDDLSRHRTAKVLSLVSMLLTGRAERRIFASARSTCVAQSSYLAEQLHQEVLQCLHKSSFVDGADQRAIR
jgi:hypothetical protein